MTRLSSPQRKRQRGLSSYEFLWVSIVMAILLVVGMGYYQRLAADSERFALQLQARNFMQAAQVVRAFWQLRAKPADTLALNGFVYRVNSSGWPLDAKPAAAPKPQAQQRCKRLLLSLIIAPNSATVKLIDTRTLTPQTLANGGCRYHGTGAGKGLYFDYKPQEGSVSSGQTH